MSTPRAYRELLLIGAAVLLSGPPAPAQVGPGSSRGGLYTGGFYGYGGSTSGFMVGTFPNYRGLTGYGYGFYPWGGSTYSVGPSRYYSVQDPNLTRPYPSATNFYTYTPPRLGTTWDSYQSYYVAPSDARYRSVPRPEADRTARLEVQAPADAQIWFEDKLTSQTGPRRRFVTPPLEAGYTYTYAVRARWTENGQEVTRRREVTVQPGQQYHIDLREADGAKP